MAAFWDKDCEDFKEAKARMPSLDWFDDNGHLYEKVDTMEELTIMLKDMGWTVEKFEENCGVKASELVGRWWMVVHNKVYFRYPREVN